MAEPTEPREHDNPNRVAGRQATALQHYLHVVVRRRLVITSVFLIVAGAAALNAFRKPPIYQGTVQILIERDAPQVLNFKDVATGDAGRDDYYQTQYRLLQSRSLAERTILGLNLLADPEFGGPRTPEEIASIKAQPPGQSPQMQGAIDGFLRRLTVTPARNSRLVAVSFESLRPDLAASAANTLSSLYITQALEFRSQTSGEASLWLEEQVAEQRRKVEAAEISLQRLKEQEGIVNLEERRTLLDQRLKELGTAITTLRTDRGKKEALYRQMRGASNPEELPDVLANPLIQSVRGELASLERQQAQLLDLYVERHPEVIRVKNQIAETRKKIASEAQRVIRAAENDYKAAAAQEASVSSQLEAAKAEALDLSSRGVQYDSLKQEMDAGKEVLNGLLSRSKQTDVVQELKSSNIRIVDPAALPRTPIRPNRSREVLLGILLGLTAGVMTAFFLDRLDDTIKTPDDVPGNLGVPLLGVIPEMTRVADDKRRSAEGYRVLRTALGYSWSEPGGRIVMVTSTAPDEGKTLTSVNTARILSTLEGEVLLIDADLRRPKAHSVLKLRKSPGLSDILVGQAGPAQAIVAVPGSRLSFLPSGTSAPSPSELMTGKVMKSFLDSLRSVYEWIIIDTPPVGAVTEPLILAPLCDGVMVVAGAEMIPRKAILRTIDRIQETGARVLGVVLNRAQTQKHSYYYAHYYGHYYGRYHAGPEGTDMASNTGKRQNKSAGGARSALVAFMAMLAGAGCEQLPETPNVPPVASFFNNPVSPIYAGQTAVSFNATSSMDSDGSISSFTWNFGDGTADVSGGAPVVTHVFPVTGRCVEVTYAVLLTVTDNGGGKGFSNKPVTVVNLPAPTSAECR